MIIQKSSKLGQNPDMLLRGFFGEGGEQELLNSDSGKGASYTCKVHYSFVP